MAMTDAIADMLSRIRNGQASKLMTVLVSFSKEKRAVLDVLKAEGYILGYNVCSPVVFDIIEISLKYSSDGIPAIREIKKVSKPGKRVYSAIRDLKGCYNNMGIYVLSTSRGVVSDREAARMNVGGEVICKVF